MKKQETGFCKKCGRPISKGTKCENCSGKTADHVKKGVSALGVVAVTVGSLVVKHIMKP